jgi:hypothetical protein
MLIDRQAASRALVQADCYNNFDSAIITIETQIKGTNNMPDTALNLHDLATAPFATQVSTLRLLFGFNQAEFANTPGVNKKTIREFYRYMHTKYGDKPMTVVGSIKCGGRYNVAGLFGALYLGFDRETCETEVKRGSLPGWDLRNDIEGLVAPSAQHKGGHCLDVYLDRIRTRSHVTPKTNLGTWP